MTKRHELNCLQVVDGLSTTERFIMPGQIRPDAKVRKIAYKILKTPKDLQQKDNPEPSKKRYESWKVDSQIYPR